MTKDLQPCPFCASRQTRVDRYATIYFVVCENCHADGPAKDSAAEAMEAWNSRRSRHDGDGA